MMEKRLFLAMILSLMVLLSFQMLAPRKQTRRTQEEPVSSMETSVQAPARELFVKERKPTSVYSRPAAKEKKPLEEKTIEINTEKYRLLFSDIGGSLKKLSLYEYQQDGKEETLLEEENPTDRMFSVQTENLAELEATKFDLIEGDNFLEYKFTEPDWAEIVKRYTFHKSFNYIELDVSIKNLTSRTIPFSYTIQGPSRLKKTGQVTGRSFLEVDTKTSEKLWKTRALKGAEEKTGDILWVGLKNRYFALILKSFSPLRSVKIIQDKGKNLLTVFNSQRQEVAPGETVVNQYLLYAGPLDEKRIEALGYGMQEVVDYGFFGSVSKTLLSILRFLHKVARNWGVAIIFLTILINIVLFPLTYKSFSAMQQMKKIQPHIQQLKNLHKDNPQKLNKETMELYKKYKVNPLGGCLPMLLQMPIFISLYQGLMRSIELKGAKFLWIKDLAGPDAVPLPFSLPLVGAHINILPLLMAGMMVVQQKLSQGVSAGAMTDEQASQQKMMMMFMPILFGFLFYKMPSGLVLYWLTNTILMTAEQTMISKRLN